jgi:hypothetical protein
MEVSGYFEYTIDPVSGEKVKVAAESKLVEMVEENIRKAPKMDALLSVLSGVPLEELDVPLEVPNIPLAQKKKKRKQKRPARAIVADESFLAGLEQNLHDKLTIDLKEKRAAAAQRIGNPELANLHAELFRTKLQAAKNKKIDMDSRATRMGDNPDLRKKEEEEAKFRSYIAKPENRKHK